MSSSSSHEVSGPPKGSQDGGSQEEEETYHTPQEESVVAPRKRGGPTVVVIPRNTNLLMADDERTTPKTSTTSGVQVSFTSSQDHIPTTGSDNDEGVNGQDDGSAGFERHDLSEKELQQKGRLIRLVKQYLVVRSNQLSKRQLQSIANVVATHDAEKQLKKNKSQTPNQSPKSDQGESMKTFVSQVESDVPSVPPPEKMSRNVYICMAYNFIDGAAFSIWQAQVLQVLLYQIADESNTTVGLVSGVGGMTQMFAALVSGFAGDILQKHTVCRAAVVVGMVAMVTSAYGVFSVQLLLFYFASAYIGVYQGFANPASEALFADSVASGRRTDIYSKKYIVQILCYLVGYLMNVLLFLRLGNDWGRPVLEKVMYVGLSVHPLAFIPLAMLNTKYALKDNDELAAKARTSSVRNEDGLEDADEDHPHQLTSDSVGSDEDDHETTATVAIFVEAAGSINHNGTSPSSRTEATTTPTVAKRAKPRKEVIETAMLELIQEAEHRSALPAQSRFANDIVYGSAAGGGEGAQNMSMSGEDMAQSARSLFNFFSSFRRGSTNRLSETDITTNDPPRAPHGPTVRRFVSAAAASHTTPSTSLAVSKPRTASVFTRIVAEDVDSTPAARGRSAASMGASRESLDHAVGERRAFEDVIDAVNAVLNKYYYTPIGAPRANSNKSIRSFSGRGFQLRSARTVQSSDAVDGGGNGSFTAMPAASPEDQSRREIVLTGGINDDGEDDVCEKGEVVLVIPVQRTALEEIEYQKSLDKDADTTSGYEAEDEKSIRNYLLTRVFNNHNIVPYCVVLGDFLQALGSGMTVRFISLYFVNTFDINPILLSCTWIFITCFTAVCAQGMNRLSRRVHRIPLMIGVRFLGSSLLGYMALVRSGPGSTLHVMLAVFICRQCLMNCSFGISRSVVMDYSSKESRSKWSAVESFSNFSWAGSAVIGGLIADAHGYHATFLVTTCLHYVATLVIIPGAIAGRKLEAIVVRMNQEEREKVDKEKAAKKAEDRAAKALLKENRHIQEGNRKSGNTSDGAERPLLGPGTIRPTTYASSLRSIEGDPETET